jgi:hypothetical protein
LLRRAEHFVTVVFLTTCSSERGELDRHELDALNTVLGEGMSMLRRANEAIEEADRDRHPVDAADDRRVPRDAA